MSGYLSLGYFLFLRQMKFIVMGEGPQGHRIKPLITQHNTNKTKGT